MSKIWRNCEAVKGRSPLLGGCDSEETRWLSVFRGSIRDIECVEKFTNMLRQFDVVVHCAAPVEFWGPWEKYEKGIIASSLELAKACNEQKVKRFIYISSESVLQDKEDLLDIDEDHPYSQEPNSFYGKSSFRYHTLKGEGQGARANWVFYVLAKRNSRAC